MSGLIGMTEGFHTRSKKAKEVSVAKYGVARPYDCIGAKKGELSEGDWGLCFFLREDKASSLNWMYIDFVIRGSSKEPGYTSEYPYVAVQVHSPRRYATPPFKLDSRFRNAFKAAISRYGGDRIKKLRKLGPSHKLVQLIKSHYQRNS